MSAPTDLELNQIGVLKRRTIEARILAPMVEAMAQEFGKERVHLGGATHCDFRYRAGGTG